MLVKYEKLLPATLHGIVIEKQDSNYIRTPFPNTCTLVCEHVEKLNLESYFIGVWANEHIFSSCTKLFKSDFRETTENQFNELVGIPQPDSQYIDYGEGEYDD